MLIKKGETIKVKVTTVVEISPDEDMFVEEIIDEFSTEAFYNFEDTDNVTVIGTEMRNVELT